MNAEGEEECLSSVGNEKRFFALKAAIGVEFQATLNSKIDQSNLDQSIASFSVGLSDVRCNAKDPHMSKLLKESFC